MQVKQIQQIMSINVETYFWMVDRLNLEDDTKNKVNKVTNFVQLSKNFLKKCENGYYLGRLLKQMYATFSNRTAKSFNVPLIVTEINPDAASFNAQTWKIIFDVLAQYGCKIEASKQDIIVKSSNTDIILDIIEALYEIDNSSTGQISAQTKRLLGIKTNHPPLQKYTDGGQGNFEIGATRSDIQSQVKPRGAFTERKNSALPKSIMLQPNNEQDQGKQRFLSPTKQETYNKISFQSPGPTQFTPSRPSMQLSPSLSSPSRILGKESSLLLSDQLDEAMPSNLESCKTSFQFIVISLAQSFEMKPKQAAALLTDNNKFLNHLVIKGAKGGDFDNVKRWYQEVYYYASHLIGLINTEKKDVRSYETPLNPITSTVNQARENKTKVLLKTLNILKCGMYSINQEVQVMAGETFLQLINEVNENIQDLQQDMWLWLTTQTVKLETRKTTKSTAPTQNLQLVSFEQSSPFKNSIVDNQNAQQLTSKDLEIYQTQTGLQGILFAYQQNNNFLDCCISLLMGFGEINPTLLFNEFLFKLTSSPNLYYLVCQDVFNKTLNTNQAERIIDQSGVLNFWITTTLKSADQNSQIILNDRLTNLIFLTNLYLERPKYFEKATRVPAETIIQILKKGARDDRRTICVISIELMFRLLYRFAAERNPFAPTLYKTLAFLLVEFYWEIDVREVMLRHFIDLYQQYEIIPLNILCEPLLKQIEISQYHATSFNVFDFEFFSFVSNHRKLTLPTGLLLFDSLVKIAMTSVYYHKSAADIIANLTQRFMSYEEFFQHIKESFRSVLNSIISIESRLVIHRFYLRQEENNFFNRLALRGKQQKSSSDSGNTRLSDQDYQMVIINERLAIGLLEKMIKYQNQLLNEELRLQLIDTYTGIQNGLKINCQAIKYLLRNFTTKIDSMIEDRQHKFPNADQHITIPFTQELSIILQIPNNQTTNRRSIEVYGSQNGITQGKLSQGKVLSGPIGQPTHDANRMFQVSVALPLNSPEKKKQEVPGYIYDYRQWEEEWEINQYTQFLKKHQKLYRELHRSYTNENAIKKPLAIHRTTFDDHEKTIDQITAVSLIKLIKDFKIENGLQNSVLKEEVIRLVKQINIYISKQSGDVQTLTFEGFMDFLLQYAYLHWQSEPNNKAYQLIEKLFNQMKDQPQFKKMNLTMHKTETTNRRDVQTIQVIQEKLKLYNDPDFQLKDYKQIDDKVSSVEYIVHPNVPIDESQKVVIELLDEIFFSSLGVHFLEPIVVETTIKKIVPKMLSRRKVSMPPIMYANVVRGNPSNQPLSHQIVLSTHQEDSKDKYVKWKETQNQKKVQIWEQSQTSEYQTSGYQQYSTQQRSTVNYDTKELFKAQALNKRAEKFGYTIQLSVIEANPLSQKQLIYECGEVMNEILTAFEKGKKALRLDFTPYKLYDLHKKKIEKLRTDTIEEEPISIDEDEIIQKQEAVQRFLNKHEAFLEEQKEMLNQKEQQKLKEARIKEFKKKKIAEEYVSLVDEQKFIKLDQQRKQMQDKAELEQKQKADLEQQKRELNDKIKQSLQKHKEKLQQQSLENQAKNQNQDQDHELQQIKKKVMNDKWSKVHQEKLQSVKQQKDENKQSFFAFVKCEPVQNLINLKFSKGLLLKYDQCLKISQKTSGVTQAGWMEWFKQNGLVTKINPRILVNIHSLQVKEIEQGQVYGDIVKTELKVAAAPPGDKEINYGGFVVALIKVANVAKTKLRQDDKSKEQVQEKKDKDEEYNQYATNDFEPYDIKNLFKLLQVAGSGTK